MRFSSAFESRSVVCDAPSQHGTSIPKEDAAAGSESAVQELPEDLDQRVRAIGEWQLEDW